MESHNSVYNLESHLVLVFALFVCKCFLKTGWGGSSLLKECKRSEGARRRSWEFDILPGKQEQGDFQPRLQLVHSGSGLTLGCASLLFK